MTIHLLSFVMLAATTWAGPTSAPHQGPQPVPAAAETPADYVIGPEDVLGIVFWREPELSGDTTVRPDGKISLPMIGTIEAAGKRPEELQALLQVVAAKYVTAPNVAVVVRAINSRKVFIMGAVLAPGARPLAGPLTVLQALALAGGLAEFSDAKNITILRIDGGRTTTLRFNYKDVSRGKKLEQNIVLQPGDTIVVP